MPSTKVTAALLAGAVTTIILWIVNAMTGVDIPPEVAAGITTVLAFVLAYFVPDVNPAPSAVAAVKNADAA